MKKTFIYALVLSLLLSFSCPAALAEELTEERVSQDIQEELTGLPAEELTEEELWKKKLLAEAGQEETPEGESPVQTGEETPEEVPEAPSAEPAEEPATPEEPAEEPSQDLTAPE